MTRTVEAVYDGAVLRPETALGLEPNKRVRLTVEVLPPAETEAERKAARERFERHFGAVNLGHPTGVDNEAIDADLARAYDDSHEGG